MCWVVYFFIDSLVLAKLSINSLDTLYGQLCRLNHNIQNQNLTISLETHALESFNANQRQKNSLYGINCNMFCRSVIKMMTNKAELVSMIETGNRNTEEDYFIYNPQMQPLVSCLKFMSFVGGFPFSFDQNPKGKAYSKLKCNRIKLFFSLVILLTPCIVMLTLLLNVSIQWGVFQHVFVACQSSFWDIFSLVSF